MVMYMVRSEDISNLLKIIRSELPTIYERITDRIVRRFGLSVEDSIEIRPREVMRIVLEEIKYGLIYLQLMLLEIFEYFKHRLSIKERFRIEFVFNPLTESILIINQEFIDSILKNLGELTKLYNSIVDELGFKDLIIIPDHVFSQWWKE